MKKRGAFSVIEVLLAMVILAIASAILLPVVSSVRERSSTASCMANLKALWNAQRGYQNDHSDNFIPYYDGKVWTWTAALMSKGYLDPSTRAFYCPAFSKATDLDTPEKVARRSGGNGGEGRRGTYSHYGYNYYHIGGSLRYQGDAFTPARGTQITNPSRTILFLDTVGNPTAAVPRGTFISVDRQGSSDVPDPRHQGSIHIVFVDGHIEAFRPADPTKMFAPYPAGLGRTIDDGSLWKR